VARLGAHESVQKRSRNGAEPRGIALDQDLEEDDIGDVGAGSTVGHLDRLAAGDEVDDPLMGEVPTSTRVVEAAIRILPNADRIPLAAMGRRWTCV
jgi:hypothetical protein